MTMFTVPIDDTAERLGKLYDSLTAAVPARVIDQGFISAAQRQPDELLRGVINIIASEEREYAQAFGRIATNQTTEVLLVCHLAIDPPADCQPGFAARQVLDAELALLNDIKRYCQSQPIDGADVVLANTQFSRQIEAANHFGWLIVTIELRPPAASTH